MNNFKKYFHGKTVLLTGHTGFKGSWLTIWLLELGAKVVGISDAVFEEPSHFGVTDLKGCVEHYLVDLKDAEKVRTIVNSIQPDYVFHLAAQALVRRSYMDPLQTFHTNILGTAHLLEALKTLQKMCVAILITSDKCYDNVEWSWGYRENDRLGGKDPYSASKGAAELVIHSYIASFFQDTSKVRIGIGRAGNVIGGGDWAPDRIIPDSVRSFSLNQPAMIRNSQATRPWQHVLEPLSGYLDLAGELTDSPRHHGEAFNFGPTAEHAYSVGTLLNTFLRYWPDNSWSEVPRQGNAPYESGLLKLNCDKALHHLHWSSTLDFEKTVWLTADWYHQFYKYPGKNMKEVSLKQIDCYVSHAKEKGLKWAR